MRKLAPGSWEGVLAVSLSGCNILESSPCTSTGAHGRAGTSCGGFTWNVLKGMKSLEPTGLISLTPLRPRSKAFNWSMPTSIPSMNCRGRWRDWFYRAKTTGFPWFRETAAYPRGVSVRFPKQKSEASHQTKTSLQRTFKSKEMWTKWKTVGQTMTYYSFHKILFLYWRQKLQRWRISIRGRGDEKGQGAWYEWNPQRTNKNLNLKRKT